ncbi:DNA topoisomerase 1 beta-like [Camellia sinensis]|uniref:DNA topoisomerase 1 beta-like n=1 Tax=Camellia sinensis TaxID=4442 RepID=UPI0010363B86|nr:DNA topoisomerase 1 beta-like [Camellia sinensis]
MEVLDRCWFQFIIPFDGQRSQTARKYLTHESLVVCMWRHSLLIMSDVICGMGKLKRLIQPRDITINIGKDAPIPECPIPGERWKEIRHDNTVTWLAFWNDPINPKEFKYVFLAASSSLKGQSDKEKYEKLRMLKDYIQGIRATYTKDFASKDITRRQIAVATYLIDKLALRAGNEKVWCM